MGKRIPQLLIALAGLQMLFLFLFPMWGISLYAPQYPDGVHMHIYINRIGGAEPGTLQNINILNHYIGMKYITPESIPELKYFQFIMLGFVLASLLVAVINRKVGYVIWTGLFILAMGLALYDFYLWEYDYGHNLDPNAIMKFEGESFQPPLIGRKVLLNFVAISFPHIGGSFLILSILFSITATWLRTRKSGS